MELNFVWLLVRLGCLHKELQSRVGIIHEFRNLAVLGQDQTILYLRGTGGQPSIAGKLTCFRWLDSGGLALGRGWRLCLSGLCVLTLVKRQAREAEALSTQLTTLGMS